MLKNYKQSDLTWGFEIEWGDIPRNFPIPSRLGAWEFAETDIVNVHFPYRGVACDPLGISPPVGGEINTKPSETWQEQVSRILEIKNLFTEQGYNPSASCVNHGHIHVHIKGLRNDIKALKRLLAYIFYNQEKTVEKCYQFKAAPLMKGLRTAVKYLKLDGGRLMPQSIFDNIIHFSHDFESFCKYHGALYQGKPINHTLRYAINTLCLKHIETIEFRCFRSSLDAVEIADSFSFVEQFILSGLNYGAPVEDILNLGSYRFPPFVFDSEQRDLYAGWEKTKYDKSRGKKKRQFYEVA